LKDFFGTLDAIADVVETLSDAAMLSAISLSGFIVFGDLDLPSGIDVTNPSSKSAIRSLDEM